MLHMAEKQRERWGSRMLFIFAAVGSAAGLGNLWRFPYLASKHGGGAFLIPYIVILLLIGVPLLLLEFAIGQRFQKGAIEGLANVNRHFSGVGMMGVLAGFVVVGYYGVVIAWAVLYLVASFKVAWAGQETVYFFEKVLHISGGINEVGAIQIPILIGLAIAWIAIYFSIWKGTRSASKVIMITMPLPILLVIILAIRGVTLGPGSMIGMQAYLFPDWIRIFTDIDVWNAAIAQIFFTLTLGFGTMIAYGSYNDKGQELVKSTYWTVFINSAISLIAGVAIFGTIGFMCFNIAGSDGVPHSMVMEYQQQKNIAVVEDVAPALAHDKNYTYQELTEAGISITQQEVAKYHIAHSKLSGPGLAFVVYPRAIASFKAKWMSALFGILFFVTLLSLGIDSIFSLVEAMSTVIADEVHKRLNRVNHSIITLWVCVAGFLTGIIYTTNAGLYFLDLIDHYITSYGLVLVGLLQAIAVGWFYNIKDFKRYINSTTNITLGTWWEISIRYIAPLLLSYLLVNQLITDVKTPYAGYPFWAQLLGWSVVILPILIGLFVSAYMNIQVEGELDT